MKTVWRVFAYLKRYPVLGISMLACAIAGTLMIMVPPVVTRKIIDEVVLEHHPELLLPLLLVAAVAFILQHGLNSLRLLINNTFEQKVIFDLRSDLYSHIQLLPLRWFDNRATGDLMTRVLEDVNSVERVLIDGIEQGTVAVLADPDRPRCNVLRECGTHAHRPIARAIPGRRRVVVHADRPSPLSTATTCSVGHEFASARQSFGHPPDQKFRARAEEHERFNKASNELRHATLVVMRVWGIYNPSMYLFGSLGVVLVDAVGTHDSSREQCSSANS